MRSIYFLLPFLMLVLETRKALANDRPTVVASVGTIRGVRASDGNYSMFMGIPFGKVNASNPFGIATPYPSFDEVFDAVNETLCPQIDEISNRVVGTIDCLDLHIYVPDSASTGNPLAVMVWIYGGIFAIGSNSKFIQGPKFLMKQDVIVVAINYRLGPYGFMCLHTPEVPGNQGLRDQVLALRWVQNNIAAFGGDTNRVFLFGLSAGAMSIDLHLFSEQEKLFNGAILQSGNAFSVQWPTEPDNDKVLALSKQLGLNTTNIDEALNFLAKFDSNSLMQAVSDLSPSVLVKVYEPCVEKKIDGIDTIIADNVVNLELPKMEGMKILIGWNEDEMMAAFGITPPALYPLLYQDYFKSNLASLFDFDNATLVTAENIVRKFYVGDDDINERTIYDLANFASDTTFVYSSERSLAKYLDKDLEVYYYVFSYDGGRNMLKRTMGATIGGAYHGDEVGYIFDIIGFGEPTPEDQLILDRMTTMWANFAKYGDPTPERTVLLPVKWEPVTKNSVYHYLNITTDIAAGTRPFHQRMAFWDMFYELYGQYEKTYKKSIDVSSASIYLLHPFLLLIVVTHFVSQIFS